MGVELLWGKVRFATGIGTNAFGGDGRDKTVPWPAAARAELLPE
jgi:hypothetical protein